MSKSAEWWLSRGGAVLTCFALILLYQYAVEKNWITPTIRLLTGTLVGALLLLWGSRIRRRDATVPEDSVGLREVLMAAGLAAWYITAYAAAVFYQMVPVSTARLLYVILSVGGSWLALRERRALLALFALGPGFATPALLPSSDSAISALAIHVAALTAAGMILYLIRGWQSVLWLTFFAFWITTGNAVSARWSTPWQENITGSDEIMITLVLIACTLGFVRVPILRRRLLALGSDRYTEPRTLLLGQSVLRDLSHLIARLTGSTAAADSAALWTITLASPLLALKELPIIWPWIPSAVWALAALSIAQLAFWLATSAREQRDEFTHVEAAGAALWSLVGAVWLTSVMADEVGASPYAACVAVASLHAFLTIRVATRFQFVVPIRIALSTSSIAIALVVLTDFVGARQGIDLVWSVAEIVTIAVAAWIWWRFRTDQGNRTITVLGMLAYSGAMLADARILTVVWQPLATASYAIAGTAMLSIAARDKHWAFLRKLGGVTLIAVVGRLLMIDLAGVATIWRVLLFLGCGALFLFTSSRLQSPGGATAQ